MSGARLSAGVVIMRFGSGGARYLLLRAFRYWDFPKGLVAAGERPLEAACREVREETGLADLVFHWGARYHETPPYSGGKVARYFLAESPGDPVSLPASAELGRPEHHEYRWVTAPEARGLLVPRVRAVLDWAESVVSGEQ